MTDAALVITSALTALAASAAALFAGLSIRAQDRAQRRQQALENFRWLESAWDDLRPQRARAARALQQDREPTTEAREILNFLESIGFLVRRQLLDLETAESVMAAMIRGWWILGGPVIAKGRAEFGPKVFEDLEWLHGELHFDTPLTEGWRERLLSREASLGNV